ncbi:MAG: YbhB/YbcL family Raf kinase inhibitor-like protein [Methanomassiliicoccaceae archaeon]|nr:YbhB/YbcL family Raf kinase inhibitor-like protein [Methanomassiliicoccaceae archaeon]
MDKGTPATITVKSAFENNKTVPVEYTGDGKDISPPFTLSDVSEKAKSIAVTMDDLKHPLFKVYNHWVIWNLPAAQEIPENIPQGEKISELGGAVQGIGYGKHKYRGPKPPFGSTHQYQYTVYVLDCLIDLPPTSKKDDLLRAMKDHILQQGSIIGSYK